jgi:hypothetical protein
VGAARDQVRRRGGGVAGFDPLVGPPDIADPGVVQPGGPGGPQGRVAGPAERVLAEPGAEMADQPVAAGGIPAGQPDPDRVHGAADADGGRHGRSLLHRPPLDHRRPGGHSPPRPNQRPARPGGGEQGRPDPPLGRVAVLEERPDVEQGPAHRTNPEQLPAAAEPGMPERGVLVAGQHLQARAHSSKGRPGGQPGWEGTRRADQGVGGPLDPDPDSTAHQGGQARGHALMGRGPGHQRIPERIEQGRGLDRRRRRGGNGVQPAKDVHRLRRGPSHDVSPWPRPMRLLSGRGRLIVPCRGRGNITQKG